MAAKDSYDGLSYEEFRRLAQDDTLSPYEKIGFPASYREGHDENILADISAKLTNLRGTGKTFADIGCGCSPLTKRLIEICTERGQRAVFNDSEEMLRHLPQLDGISKISGRFPECATAIRETIPQFDAILCYSVLHYVFTEASIFDFVDNLIGLLAPGGQLLLGDLPNVSKRKRFFSSEAGLAYHKAFMNTDEHPSVSYNTVEYSRIDDAIILGLIMRARLQGCDAYWLPQGPLLPMSNRREDLLITKP